MEEKNNDEAYVDEDEYVDEASTSSTSRSLTRTSGAQALKIRNKKQEEWASSLKLEDVVFNESITEIVSIAGKPFGIFRSKMLLSFCRGNQITVSNGKTKKQDCVELIINYKKNGPLRAKVAHSLSSRKNKGTKPACVTMDGTLYRYILTITQGSSRTTYLQMLKSRTKQDLDKGLWKLLSEAYNDETNEYLTTLGCADNIYSIYANEDEPLNFDYLSDEDMSVVNSYVNHWYGKSRRNMSVSGQNGHIEDYIFGKGWLLFYHNKLEETGDTALKDGAYAELPKNVFMESTASISSSSPSGTCSKRRFAQMREAAELSYTNKNEVVSEVAKIALQEKIVTLKEKNQKRFESLSDEIFELEEKYESMQGMEMESKRRKYYKSKIVRLKLSLDDLKKDMNYKEPGVDAPKDPGVDDLDSDSDGDSIFKESKMY